MTWIDVGPLADLPPRGARVVRVGAIDIAVFRTGAGEVFALRDRCPHRGGPLSQGIVHGDRVTCPLHDWIIDLKSGSATGVDQGCTPTFAVRVANGRVSLEIPDAVAATPAACAAPVDIVREALEPRAYALFERA